jgi:hypothetical protein
LDRDATRAFSNVQGGVNYAQAAKNFLTGQAPNNETSGTTTGTVTGTIPTATVVTRTGNGTVITATGNITTTGTGTGTFVTATIVNGTVATRTRTFATGTTVNGTVTTGNNHHRKRVITGTAIPETFVNEALFARPTTLQTVKYTQPEQRHRARVSTLNYNT